MKGIILAAGRGQRLGSLGQDRPKCLLELCGRPLLQWQRDALERAGITDLGLVCGYRAEQLPQQGWTRFLNSRWSETGVVTSALAAGAWLKSGPCLVSYADIIYGPDVVAALCETPGDIAITSYSRWRSLWEARFSDPLHDAETFKVDRGGRLIEIGRRANHLDDIQGQFMGLIKFTPNGFRCVLDYLERLGSPAERLDMTSLLQGLITVGVHVQTQTVSGLWYEVDSAADAYLFPAWITRNGEAGVSPCPMRP